MSIIRSIYGLLKRISHPNTYSSDAFVRYLKRKGVVLGKGCVFYAPDSCVVDVTNPEMLTMGDNVRITHGVTILTHDYSWSVLAGVYGEALGGISPVHIGSNVFVGMNSTILKGTTIGDNVIVAAGSIVTKDIPSNEVWGGAPAKRIMTLSEYYQHKKESSHEELLYIVSRFKDKPDSLKRLLREYEPFFMDYNSPSVAELLDSTGYGDVSRKFYKNNSRKYQDLTDLIKVNKL